MLCTPGSRGTNKLTVSILANHLASNFHLSAEECYSPHSFSRTTYCQRSPAQVAFSRSVRTHELNFQPFASLVGCTLNEERKLLQQFIVSMVEGAYTIIAARLFFFIRFSLLVWEEFFGNFTDPSVWFFKAVCIFFKKKPIC